MESSRDALRQVVTSILTDMDSSTIKDCSNLSLSDKEGWVYYLDGQTLGVLKAITKKINDQGEMHDRANNRQQRKRIETGGSEGHLRSMVRSRLVDYIDEAWRESRDSAILERLNVSLQRYNVFTGDDD